MKSERKIAQFHATGMGAAITAITGSKSDSYTPVDNSSTDSFSTEFQNEIEAELKHIRSKSF